MMQFDSPWDGEEAGINEEMQKHLMTEMYAEAQELGEIGAVIHELKGKEMRRMKRIKEHTMHCGECLSAQIKNGTLITVEDYWELREQSGGGRFPKLHYMVN